MCLLNFELLISLYKAYSTYYCYKPVFQREETKHPSNGSLVFKSKLFTAGLELSLKQNKGHSCKLKYLVGYSYTQALTFFGVHNRNHWMWSVVLSHGSNIFPFFSITVEHERFVVLLFRAVRHLVRDRSLLQSNQATSWVTPNIGDWVHMEKAKIPVYKKNNRQLGGGGEGVWKVAIRHVKD